MNLAENTVVFSVEPPQSMYTDGCGLFANYRSLQISLSYISISIWSSIGYSVLTCGYSCGMRLCVHTIRPTHHHPTEHSATAPRFYPTVIPRINWEKTRRSNLLDVYQGQVNSVVSPLFGNLYESPEQLNDEICTVSRIARV